MAPVLPNRPDRPERLRSRVVPSPVRGGREAVPPPVPFRREVSSPTKGGASPLQRRPLPTPGTGPPARHDSAPSAPVRRLPTRPDHPVPSNAPCSPIPLTRNVGRQPRVSPSPDTGTPPNTPPEAQSRRRLPPSLPESAKRTDSNSPSGTPKRDDSPGPLPTKRPETDSSLSPARRRPAPQRRATPSRSDGGGPSSQNSISESIQQILEPFGKIFPWFTEEWEKLPVEEQQICMASFDVIFTSDK